ncbi:MAG TPA: hypothetical protein VL484_15145 [Vicinamibacterales bacterium]|nr:hypothetical protein [Vicinamibacterales bacterium]
MTQESRLVRNPISIVGAILTTVSAVVFLVVFLTDILGFHTNPYLGIVFFFILPAIFVIGLVLIPIGARAERRRRAAGKAPLEWPRLDLNDPAHRRTVLIVSAVTLANVAIVSMAAYRGIEYMDTVSFCGQVCHTPMKPEFVAHEGQPHANVSCVACHVAPGAPGFTRAKISGTRQLVAIAMNSFPRPIVAHPDRLLPSTASCERCHWPEQFHGDRVRRVVEFGDDEKNTQSVTTIRVHVGGGNTREGKATGIHWHMNVGNTIEYIATDTERQNIPYVRLTDGQGHVREYVAAGYTREQFANAETRRMDCTDCHNRPNHAIDPTPEKAVNRAMAIGDIPPGLPFVHREAVKALKGKYETETAAMAGIERSLREFYTAQPQLASAHENQIDGAVAAVQNIYRHDVFPEMHVTFGTYPNNIGHIDSPGCFRCHDDTHAATDGKKIGQDCETCHAIE